MKTINAIKKIFSILFLACIIISCSDKYESDDLSPKLIISSVSVLENQDMVELLSDVNNQHETLSTKMASNSVMIVDRRSDLKSKYIIHENTDFDYSVNLSSTANELQNNVNTTNQAGVKTLLNTSKSSLKAVDVSFGATKKFRLVIYPNGQITNPIYNEILQVNDKPNIKLSVGATYNWYAFTIGESGSVPNINSAGKISKSEIANKDFMLAKGTTKISSGENFLKIIFKRQTARIQVTLNTRGVFGPMQNSTTVSAGESVNGTYSTIVKAGDYNILSDQYTDITDYDIGISAADAVNLSSLWPNEEKRFSLYTALNSNKNIAAGTLQVKLKSLSITLDNNTTRTFSPNSIITLSTTSALTLAKGSSSSINVQLIESPIIVGGIKWARTNLVYDPSKLNAAAFNIYNTSSNAYRFRPDNNYSKGLPNEYWNYSSLPNGTDINVGDPCQYVYPYYSWVAASNYRSINCCDFDKLENSYHYYNSTYVSSDNGYKHSINWPGEGKANPAYPDNNILQFIFLGRRVDGIYQDNPRSSSSSAGGLYYYHGGQRQYGSYYQVMVFTKTKPVGSSTGSFHTTITDGYDGHIRRCVRMNN